MIIPEVELLKLIEALLKYVELDFNNATDEQNTFLYRVFKDNNIGRYNFFEQAKDIFLRDKGHPRKIETRIMFDAQRAQLPTIHISLPGESTENNGIGMDEGYQEHFYDENTRTISYTRGFNAQYSCIVTSDNALEVLTVYYVLKNILIAATDNAEFRGLRNVQIGGNDLQINSDIVPPHIFTRGINISVFYEQTIPSLRKDEIVEINKILMKNC